MGLPRTNLLGCILAVAASQPNFVYILMDDTDELLGSASLMTRTKALVGDRGATFSRFRTLSPKCTPSRTGQLTGRHYHNVRPGARGPGLDEATLFDADALFPALRRAGVEHDELRRALNELERGNFRVREQRCKSGALLQRCDDETAAYLVRACDSDGDGALDKNDFMQAMLLWRRLAKDRDRRQQREASAACAVM